MVATQAFDLEACAILTPSSRQPSPSAAAIAPRSVSWRLRSAGRTWERSRPASWAYAIGPSGFGAAYCAGQARLDRSGAAIEPKGEVGLGVWGHDQGLDDPFPVLGGSIITPTIDIYTRERAAALRRLRPGSESSEISRSARASGPAAPTVGEIMRLAGERGRTMLR